MVDQMMAPGLATSADQFAAKPWYTQALFGAHPCWISPYWTLQYLKRDRADAREWVRLCQNAGIDSLLFVTKQHDGQCVFATKLDSPTIGHDFLADICAAAADAQIRIMAYYSVGIDAAQAERHPDWEFQDRSWPTLPLHGVSRRLPQLALSPICAGADARASGRIPHRRSLAGYLAHRPPRPGLLVQLLSYRVRPHTPR